MTGIEELGLVLGSEPSKLKEIQKSPVPEPRLSRWAQGWPKSSREQGHAGFSRHQTSPEAKKSSVGFREPLLSTGNTTRARSILLQLPD